MFRSKRPDILVRTLEQQYNIELNVRGDMKLGNLLRTRGFQSWTQFITAYRGKATKHARKRRVFLSFHAEDRRQIAGFRLMLRNPEVHLSLYDRGLIEPINSERGSYIRTVIKPLIAKSEVLVCLIGNGTAWRDWVDWEIRTAYQLGRGICGVKLKGSRGRVPPALSDVAANVVHWSVPVIVAAIEQSAARRS